VPKKCSASSPPSSSAWTTESLARSGLPSRLAGPRLSLQALALALSWVRKAMVIASFRAGSGIVRAAPPCRRSIRCRAPDAADEESQARPDQSQGQPATSRFHARSPVRSMPGKSAELRTLPLFGCRIPGGASKLGDYRRFAPGALVTLRRMFHTSSRQFPFPATVQVSGSSGLDRIANVDPPGAIVTIHHVAWKKRIERSGLGWTARQPGVNLGMSRMKIRGQTIEVVAG
jgi:hypothetical protein